MQTPVVMLEKIRASEKGDVGMRYHFIFDGHSYTYYRMIGMAHMPRDELLRVALDKDALRMVQSQFLNEVNLEVRH